MQNWPVPTTLKHVKGFLAQQAFILLKEAMIQALVLALPNFQKPFIVETDASRVGVSSSLDGIEKVDRVSFGQVFPYQNRSLKYLLDQKITTPAQMKWLPKLIGFDYEVVYKKGTDNAAIDALSRRENTILASLLKGETRKHYALHNGQLPRKGKLVVGVRTTTYKICSVFYWKGLRKQIKQFIKECLLLLSISYHPQTDGQTEVVNRYLEGYLKYMFGEHPKGWVKWISLAELWYNLNYYSAIDTTPFEALYGQPPPVYVPYVGGLTDKNRAKRSFEVGSWVLLKLQPYRQVSIRQGKQNKISVKYFGPFEVLAKVGTVAYKLRLPTESQIHNVFHVSQFKKVHGNHHLTSLAVLPQVTKEGLLKVTLVQILERKIVKENNDVAIYGLIQ
ncbi:retrotransposable element Tf2 [Tanacetum coccineum]